MPLSRFDERELDNLRRLTSHKEIATARALHYCATNQCRPPQWLMEEAAFLLIDLLKRDKGTRRGRNASRLARFRQQLIDTERWLAVKDVQEIRGRAKRDEEALKRLPKLPLDKRRKKHFADRRKWLNHDNFECASKMLKGRAAKTNAHGIRASYRQIENERRKHPELMVGAWFDDDFLRALGLQTSCEREPGTKFMSFFDLT